MRKSTDYVGSLFEEWRPVKDYDGLYEVSNCGKVRSLNYGRSGEVKELKAGKNKDGYLNIGLRKDGKRKMHTVHRLVYEAFNGAIPAGMEINHLDENKLNNWLDNLALCTRKENINYGTRNERVAKANINRKDKSKPIQQIDKLTGEVINTFPSINEAERQTGIHQTSIGQCCLGKPWYKSAGGFKWKYSD